MAFDLKDYVEVKDRLTKFWKEHPTGRVTTKILKWEEGVITIRAKVYDDKEDKFPSATGHAYEKENSTFINKTSAVENCETSAMGRALALRGYEVKKSIASREEVANALKQQEKTKGKSNAGRVLDKMGSKKEEKKPEKETKKTDKPEEELLNEADLLVCQTDISAFYAKLTELGLDKAKQEKVSDWVKAKYKVKSKKELTVGQLRKALDAVTAKIEKNNLEKEGEKAIEDFDEQEPK